MTVQVTHPQAGFHQTGTRRMAKRIVLPDGVLPATWRAVLQRHLARETRRSAGR